MTTAWQHKGMLILLVVLLSAATSLLTVWLGVRTGTWETSEAGTEQQTPAVFDDTELAATMASDDSSLVAPLNQRISELEATLAQEQQGRLILQRELADQELQLEELIATVITLSTDIESDANTVEQDQTQPNEVMAEQGRPARRNSGAGFRQPATAAALVEAGVDESVALELIARQDARALAELELRDQAAREGWLDAEDFQDRLEANLPERVELRDALEAEQWDQYLYSSGRSNRVAISGVLNGSAAYNALLQTGDQLLSYAGQPIFRVRDLQRGTRAGNKGEMVVVRVLRDGEVLELTVPRGPLGVNLSAERIDPVESGINP